MKTCSKCGEEKELSEFYANPRGADGRRGDCKACVLAERKAAYASLPEMQERIKKQATAWARANPAQRRATHLLAAYGMSLAEYEGLRLKQFDHCAICDTDDPGTSSGHWCVDHDHETDEVRGLLCRSCNLGLGLFSDDPERLLAAAAHLISPPALDI